MNMYVLSVSKAGECINVEIGHEEDIMPTISNEIGQAIQQAIQIVYSTLHTKKRATKAIMCLNEDEYEFLKPAVGDEVSIEVKKDEVTLKFIR
jgi:hypothetical protein